MFLNKATMEHSSKTCLKDRIAKKHQLEIELYDIDISIFTCYYKTTAAVTSETRQQ